MSASLVEFPPVDPTAAAECEAHWDGYKNKRIIRQNPEWAHSEWATMSVGEMYWRLNS
jgi:hypothetical protein